jgi:hypothetical protein
MITAFVIGFVAVSSLYTLHRLITSKALHADYLATLRAVRWWMVPAGVLNLAVVLGMYAGLTWLAPWMTFGWYKFAGVNGNVWAGQTGNSGLGWQIAALGIPLVLLAVVPLLAHQEEVTFREGSEKKTIPARIRRQLWFGLCHCVFAAVPIGIGLALSLSGFYFERVYLKGGLAKAAAAHTVSNGIVLGALLTYLIIKTIG